MPDVDLWPPYVHNVYIHTHHNTYTHTTSIHTNEHACTYTYRHTLKIMIIKIVKTYKILKN